MSQFTSRVPLERRGSRHRITTFARTMWIVWCALHALGTILFATSGANLFSVLIGCIIIPAFLSYLVVTISDFRRSLFLLSVIVEPMRFVASLVIYGTMNPHHYFLGLVASVWFWLLSAVVFFHRMSEYAATDAYANGAPEDTNMKWYERAAGYERTEDEYLRAGRFNEVDPFADLAHGILAPNVYGTVAGNIASANQFGAAGELGVRGEKVVGGMLNELAAQYPDRMSVFHGVKFSPEQGDDKNWDVDHMVLIDRQLILVDAKWWAGGEYKWRFLVDDGEASLQVVRDSQKFAGGAVHMADAMSAWDTHFRYWDNHGRLTRDARSLVPVSSHAYVALAQPGKGRYEIDNSEAPSRVELTTVDDLREELVWLAERSQGRSLFAEKAVAFHLLSTKGRRH